MKRICVFFILIAAIFSTSCNDEQVPNCTNRNELVLSFGVQKNFDIQVGSRATLNEIDENKIYNAYIIIFDTEGNKRYSHYFNTENLNATTEDNYWIINNKGTNTTGELHLKAFKPESQSRAYVLANINAEMVNISPERLSLIQTESEAKAMTASMIQKTVSRSGYFPMAGTTIIEPGSAIQGNINLERLDAKIIFNIKIGKVNGQKKIKEFIPHSWQVYNVPESSLILNRSKNSSSNNSENIDINYFNTNEMNFDLSSHQGGSFSFYMQENLYTSKKNPGSVQNRSKRRKDDKGINGDWMYAGPNSTFVVVKGRVIVDNPKDLQNEDNIIGTSLIAEVQYVIHLGDFSENKFNDFNTLRNTQYTYNVTINGIDDIRWEVKTDEENAPGATGHVTIAKEEIFECDAHYSSHVLTFRAKNINPENMTWYVKTPFCEGKPTIIAGTDATAGLDYKWVHFQVNKKDNTGQLYSKKRMIYNPTKTMDIVDLIAYLKDQAKKFHHKPEPLPNDFDNSAEPQICITAHVDEFYYEMDPIRNEYDPNLWRRFVNQPMRVMHILSESENSKDKESLIIGSSATIQQKSIQTIYNEKDPTITSAWGCEYTDEFPNQWGYEVTKDKKNRGNTDPYNGRLNTCKEWELTKGNTFQANQRWDKFLNFNVDNDTPLLQKEYQSLRYSCMMRNRDNNGNGLIDEDEVRWYMASIRQLVDIWMGADGIESDARLYRKGGKITPGDKNSWRQHVISSTLYQGYSSNPSLIWAEEASSIGGLDGSPGGNIYSVRCVRNLGNKDGKDITFSSINTPIDEVVLIDNVKPNNADKPFVFNLNRLNSKSIRYYTSKELNFADENSMQNRLFMKFEAQPTNVRIEHENLGFIKTNEKLDNEINANPFCPKGYRLPNQRELTLMRMYLPENYWQDYTASISRTFFSFGSFGNKLNENTEFQTGWIYYNDTKNNIQNVQMGNLNKGKDKQTSSFTRCVRDMPPTTNK